MTEIQAPNASPCLEMAHVLFMDIVAYSQLPMDEQTRLVGKLQQIVRSTTEFVRARVAYGNCDVSCRTRAPEPSDSENV